MVATENTMQRLGRLADDYLARFGDAPHFQYLIRTGMSQEEALDQIEAAIDSGKPLNTPSIALDTDL